MEGQWPGLGHCASRAQAAGHSNNVVKVQWLVHTLMCGDGCYVPIHYCRLHDLHHSRITYKEAG